MTKKQAPAAPLLPAVREQAEAIRARGKTVRLPAAADMPPVEVIRLDGTRGPADRGTQYAMMNAPRTFAWMRVHAALAGLAGEPEVLAHPAAAEFVEVLAEMARTATLADTAAEALAPVDGLLPMGARGAPFAANSGRGESPLKKLVRAVLPRLEKRLGRKATVLEVWHACAARRGSGIKFHVSATWGEPLRAAWGNDESASWARFRVIVSEVRKSPKT